MENIFFIASVDFWNPGEISKSFISSLLIFGGHIGITILIWYLFLEYIKPNNKILHILLIIGFAFLYVFLNIAILNSIGIINNGTNHEECRNLLLETFTLWYTISIPILLVLLLVNQSYQNGIKNVGYFGFYVVILPILIIIFFLYYQFMFAVSEGDLNMMKVLLGYECCGSDNPDLYLK